MTIEVKATKQYFPMVLFTCIMLFEVVPTFEFVDEILKNNTIQMKATCILKVWLLLFYKNLILKNFTPCLTWTILRVKGCLKNVQNQGHKVTSWGEHPS